MKKNKRRSEFIRNALFYVALAFSHRLRSFNRKEQKKRRRCLMYWTASFQADSHLFNSPPYTELCYLRFLLLLFTPHSHESPTAKQTTSSSWSTDLNRRGAIDWRHDRRKEVVLCRRRLLVNVDDDCLRSLRHRSLLDHHRLFNNRCRVDRRSWCSNH